MTSNPSRGARIISNTMGVDGVGSASTDAREVSARNVVEQVSASTDAIEVIAKIVVVLRFASTDATEVIVSSVLA